MPVVIEPERLSVPDSSWRRVDLAPFREAGDHDPRVGFFQVRNTTGDFARRAGIRGIDSNLDTRAQTWNETAHFRYVPIRENSVDVYRDPGVEIWYHGYVDRRVGGSHFIPKRLPVHREDEWYRVDMNKHVSANSPPKMVFVRFVRPDQWGFRRAGVKHPTQQENMRGRVLDMVHGAVGFCDSNGHADLYVQEEATLLPYIVGWVTDRADATARQVAIHPSADDTWVNTDLGAYTADHDGAWLFQGNNHRHAAFADHRVRVAARTPGSDLPHYLHAGLVQWRPVKLGGSNARTFQSRISKRGATTIDGGGVWLVGRTGEFDFDRLPPDDPDDPDAPTDPDDDLRAIGVVDVQTTDGKRQVPVFNPDHVDGACWRVSLDNTDEFVDAEGDTDMWGEPVPADHARVAAFALAPRHRAAFPEFTIETESGRYGLHDLGVEPETEVQPFPPSAVVVETGNAVDIGTESVTLEAAINQLGSYDQVDVAFQIRES